MKILIFFFSLIYGQYLLAASTDLLNIEHQIRLCDDKQTILDKIKNDPWSSSFNSNSYKVYYIDTANRDFEKNQWSIRARIKKNKTEITVKKKFPNIPSKQNIPPEMICEFDLHGSVKEYSCKINSDIANSDFENIIKKQTNLLDVLDSSQVKFLKDNNLNLKDILVYGTLINVRLQWNHPQFGTITLDLVELNGK